MQLSKGDYQYDADVGSISPFFALLSQQYNGQEIQCCTMGLVHACACQQRKKQQQQKIIIEYELILLSIRAGV